MKLFGFLSFPLLFSLYFLRHRRLRAWLEEVPWPLLQVGIMKNRLWRWNKWSFLQPHVPRLSALYSFLHPGVILDVLTAALPTILTRQAAYYMKYVFWYPLSLRSPTGTSVTDTPGRMQRKTAESTVPISVALFLLLSRSLSMVCVYFFCFSSQTTQWYNVYTVHTLHVYVLWINIYSQNRKQNSI